MATVPVGIEPAKPAAPKWASNKEYGTAACLKKVAELEAAGSVTTTLLTGQGRPEREIGNLHAVPEDPRVLDRQTFYMDDPRYDSITVDPIRNRSNLWYREEAGLLPQEASLDRAARINALALKATQAIGTGYQRPFTAYTPTAAELESLPKFYTLSNSYFCWQGEDKAKEPDGKNPWLLDLIRKNALGELDDASIRIQQRDRDHALDARLNGTVDKLRYGLRACR